MSVRSAEGVLAGIVGVRTCPQRGTAPVAAALHVLPAAASETGAVALRSFPAASAGIPRAAAVFRMTGAGGLRAAASARCEQVPDGARKAAAGAAASAAVSCAHVRITHRRSSFGGFGACRGRPPSCGAPERTCRISLYASRPQKGFRGRGVRRVRGGARTCGRGSARSAPAVSGNSPQK